MFAVELRFIHGRFHATPWGRNVNEGIPEWPPSPFRLARALYDTWKRKRSDWPAERVEPIMRALAGADIVFDLPPARMSHLRLFYRQGSQKETDKKKVFDPFVVTNPRDAVYVGFPSAKLSTEQRADFAELCRVLMYLGRAESLISASVVERDGPWNCRPATTSGDSRGHIERVATLSDPGGHFAVELEPASPPTKRAAARAAVKLSWLDAIAWGSEKTIEYKLNQPPALEWFSYRRASDALAALPSPRLRRRTTEEDTVVLALDGRVRPRIIESIRVGDEVRRRAMGAHRWVMGGDPARVSQRFSGKDAQGTRLMDAHAHASFVAWDRDGDGIVDHVIVMARGGFDREEILALHRLAPLLFPNREHPSRLLAISIGERSRIFEPSTHFVSATPFLPTRHYRSKRDGAFEPWLRDQLSRSLRNHGLPDCINATPLPYHTLDDQRRVRWLEYRRSRRGETAQMGFGFAIDLSRPVHGPFSIGGESHFGMGLFVPRQIAPTLARSPATVGASAK